MNTTASNFRVLNFTGQELLSGYALSASNFTFIPDFTNNSINYNKNLVIWNFGDGSISTSITATHSYEWPGQYIVSQYLYDRNNTVYQNSFVQVISVTNFIQPNLSITLPVSTTLASQLYPFTVSFLNSWQTYNPPVLSAYTINFYVSGAPAPLFIKEQYYADPWAHLKTVSTFQLETIDVNLTEYIIVDSIQLPTNLLYAVYDSNIQNYILCPSGTPNSFFVGTSGSGQAYFKSDIPTITPLVIFCSLDTTDFSDSFTQGNNIPQSISYINTNPVGFYLDVLPNIPTNLVFSSNGIISTGNLPITAFNISPINWSNTWIPFVARFTDNLGYPLTYQPLLCSIQLLLQDSNSNTISAQFNQLPISNLSLLSGGYYFGTLFTANTGLNLNIQAITNSPSITGYSSKFNILPYKGYDIFNKVNENFDMKGYYNSLRTPEYMYYKNVLFNDFIGNIVGTLSGQAYELGKTVYEKIANYVDNISHIDTANIPSLISLADQYGVNVQPFTFTLPAQLQRVADMISIKHSKLFGTPNNFNEDFKKYGSSIASQIGVNLGSLIDPITGTIGLSENFVAYEIFTSTFNIIRFPVLSAYSLGDQLPLSAYNSDWNLSLAIPDEVAGSNICQYYSFYRLLPTLSAGTVDNIINWEDINTTLSMTNSAYSNWINSGGIMDTALNYEISKGLRLFTSAVNIQYNS